MGVDTGGAGDQGLMFGYACRETPELMPLPIMLAHQLCAGLVAGAPRAASSTTSGRTARPRSRVEYDGDTPDPRRHRGHLHPAQPTTSSTEKLRDDIIEQIIKQVVPAELMDAQDQVSYINPTGRFVVGGPQGDAGLTGRKIIVDTYGGAAPHGGGAFSGKDPTKVDRSACYMARYIAKNIVAAGLAERCEVQLAYAIGVAEPVSVLVDTFGTGKVSDEVLVDAGPRELRADAARASSRTLDLRRPIYRKTAAFGHFGREDAGFAWEKTDKAAALKAGATASAKA